MASLPFSTDPTNYRQKLAEMLASNAFSTAPVQSPWQGAARMANALMLGLDDRKNEQDSKDATAWMARALLGQGGADGSTSAAPVASPATPSAPATPGTPMAAAPAGDMSQPRGIRNNNPLNIEAGTFTQGQPGYAGSDGRFARFSTPDQGAAAAGKLLDTYNTKYGLNTVNGIIGRWAPTSDGNNVSAYAADVSRRMGVDPNSPLDMANPDVKRSLIGAMAQYENGRPVQIASLDPGAGVSASAAQPAPAAPAGPQMAQAAPAAAPAVNAQIRAMILQGMNSPNPAIRAQAQALAGQLVEQQLKPPSYNFQAVGDKLIRTDNRGGYSIVPGVGTSKPTYGVIGKDDFGKELYGWINPETQSTTPAPQQQSAAAGASTIPAAPPGVDPKVWREAQSKRAAEEGMPASGEVTSKLRNEIQGLPSYKNLAQAAPVYKSMAEAAGRDTRAADVNMIYGMAKIMDPNSVVREGEMTVAQAVATLPQQLRSAVESQLRDTGRLSPEVRAAIMQEAKGRIGAYQGMFDQDMNMYRGIAQRGRMDERDVIPTFGPFEDFKPPVAAPAVAPPAPQAAPPVIDPAALEEARRRGLIK
ncbi:hypothetical protein [Bradyrhizobium sp. USDA 3458]|uniref:hypothetical protein n=1 Tax=Bradyrhizobium sp. USDA 3458 TaxID=2591461 RepID=UPI001142B221|nr:hypothetical protein [Bradyrhizobium sp. USDA 3458]